MKIKIILGLLLSLFLIKNVPINAQTEIKESVLYNNVGAVEKVYNLKNCHLLIHEDKIKVKSSSYTLVINGEYLDHVEGEGKLFILYKEENLRKVALVENQILKETFIFDSSILPVSIRIQNNSLIVMGEMNNFGYLSFYNYNLELLNEYFYGEDNGLVAQEVFNINNKWYLFCEKDSHSSNGFFENIGSDKERKVCLLVLNNQFAIEKIKYINCDDGVESLEKIYFQDNCFWFAIKGETKYHYFKSDIDMNKTIKLLEETNLEKEIILNYQNEFLRFKTEPQLIMYYHDQMETLSNNDIKGLYIEDGLLKFIHLRNNNLYLNEVSEYHIDYLHPFEIDFFEGSLEKDVDLNHSKYVEISSYFGEVKVFLNSEIDYRVSGTYDVSLIIKRVGCSDIAVNNSLIIYDYCNIFNGGVYATGKQLKFMGRGYLNGTEITNGHQVSTPGLYTLELKNNNNDTKTYKFEIVDDYYNRSEINQKYDYVVNPNEPLKISIDLENSDTVKELWVNGEKVTFQQNNDILEFEITGKESSCITEYKVEKIVYENKEVEYTKTFKVYTLKKLPSLSVKEVESEYPLILIKVNDFDMSLLKLEISYTIDGTEKVINYYFNNMNFEISELLNKSTNLKVTLVYTNGLGEIFKKNLIDFSGVFKKEQAFKIETLKTQNGIEEIKITFNKITDIEKLNVVDESIKDNYNYVFSFTSLIVSGSLTILIIGGIIFIFIRKRRQKKNGNEKEAIVE